MSFAGEKITRIRKNRGLTQEELAEMSKINLRTLQRIESGSTEPRTSTLRQVCGALQISIEEVIDNGLVADNKYLMWLHLSPAMAFIFPLGNIVIPLILWLNKRDKIAFVREQGADIINFQIIWYSFTVIFAGLIMFSRFIPFIYYLFIAFFLVNVLYPVIVGMLVRKGKVRTYYPCLVRFVK